MAIAAVFAAPALASVRHLGPCSFSLESAGRSSVYRTCSITAVVCSVYFAMGSPPRPKSASAGAGRTADTAATAANALSATSRRDVVAST